MHGTCRVASCVLLKLFLEWIIGYNAVGYAEFPLWKGWAIAAGLGSTGYLMCLVHHQLFWRVPSLPVFFLFAQSGGSPQKRDNLPD